MNKTYKLALSIIGLLLVLSTLCGCEGTYIESSLDLKMSGIAGGEFEYEILIPEYIVGLVDREPRKILEKELEDAEVIVIDDDYFYSDKQSGFSLFKGGLEKKLKELRPLGSDQVDPLFKKVEITSNSVELVTNEDLFDGTDFEGVEEGMKLTITITMPGRIVKYPSEGTLSEDEKTLTYELASFSSSKVIYVECEKNAVLSAVGVIIPIAIAAVLAVLAVIPLVIAVIVILILVKKNKSATPSDKKHEEGKDQEIAEDQTNDSIEK